MLAIRLQRTGRKGHSQYRMIVQDSRFSPKSARVVHYLGSYNPHTKEANIDVKASEKYLNNGAQPSDRVASILKESGVKLPKWYSKAPTKKRSIKNPEKLRKNRPAEPEVPAKEEAQVEVEPSEAQSSEPTSEDSKQDNANTQDAKEATEPTTEEESPAPDSTESAETESK